MYLARMVLLVTLVAVATSSSLLAAPDAASDKAERGRKMGLAAVDLARSGSYAEAADLFQKVYDLTGDSMALYNLGQVAARMGDLPKAREALERFVKEEKDPEALAKGRQALKDVMARWPGSIRVTTSGHGALVEVDGKPVGKTPLAKVIEVAPGPHQVKVVAPGKRPFERKVEVASSVSVELPVTLEDEPAAVSPAPVVAPPTVVAKVPAAPSTPAVAPNDLSGRVDVNAKKGLSTTAWVLIGSGAAAVVAGGIAAAVLLARGGGGGNGTADVKWTLR